MSVHGLPLLAIGGSVVCLALGMRLWGRRERRWERLQGVFLAVGLSGLALSLLTMRALGPQVSAAPAVTFQAGVKAVMAAEGIPEPAPPPLPHELRIVSARYGAQDRWVDVKGKLERRIERHTLQVGAGNDLAGDPIYGTPKTLQVEYVLDGKPARAELPEGDTLRIPPDPLDPRQVITTPARLAALARACPAQVGFCGKNLVTGQTVAYRPDQPACLASIVKLFALLEVMRRAEAGTLDLAAPITVRREQGTERRTVAEAVDLMVGLSDNDATAAIARLVGYDKVNALPGRLGIGGLSDQVLPPPGVLEEVLDRRVTGLHTPGPTDLLPQHGTARALGRFMELLCRRELLSEPVSRRVQEVLDRHPMVVTPHAAPAGMKSGGKGGSLLWIRPPHQTYNMLGWAVLIRGEGTAVALALWAEWFPAGMSEREQLDWCRGLSECVVGLLPKPTALPAEPQAAASARP